MDVSELLALKIENIALNLRLMQLQQEKLIDEARKEADAPVDYLYNISTRQFQAPNGT